MSVIGSNILAGASGQGGGYNLTNSLRFRSSASAYLSRTPASAGNQKTWTYSAWVKKSAIIGSGNRMGLFGVGPQSAGVGNFCFAFANSASGGADTLIVDRTGVSGPTSTAVYRDCSAWYHVVIAVNTTLASNRVRVYVNGNEITSWSASLDTVWSQNTDTLANSTNQHRIGQFYQNSEYFDGYLTEVNFIDGQALTPSSFGQTSATTGVWQPKKYAGTYGTNGFYLPFTDNTSLTTSSNVGLGKDFSGNGNYWVTENISITSGATYDSMTDVPTLTSATASNFATLNPLALGTSQTSLTQGNLYAVPISGASNWGTAFSTIAIPTSGKYYIEATAVAITGSGNSSSLGVVDSTAFTPSNSNILYTFSGGEGFDGILANLFNDYVSPISDGSQGTNVTGITGTTVNLMLALDVDNGKVYAGYNGTWLNSGNPAGNTGEVATRTFSPTDVVAGHTSWNGTNDQSQYYNFGQRPFAYTPPTGFVALNTYNLPTPTIGATASSQANKYFDVALHTGNGGTTNVTSLNFQPDFVWIKARSNAANHGLMDSVRGVAKQLSSSLTAAELDITDGMLSFNSNGFTVQNETDGYSLNTNGYTYADWCWKANGTGVTNTAGSITSTVSANTTSGFSVVTFTGNATAGATVGHGLGVAPKMVIYKARNNGNDWWSYHAGLTSAAYAIQLNTTAAQNNTVNFFNSTAPNSSVLTLGYWNNATGFNLSTQNYVAYCFSEVAGYSKFGSYTGNGSSDGPLIFTGFKPKYVLIKRTDTSGENWVVYDTARSPYNYADDYLKPNTSEAETTYFDDALDIVSNGIKVRASGSRTALNASGATYVYACFAETPFKYSLAR